MAQSSSSRNNTASNETLHPPSSSRPRSILNVSRASALTPSLSSHTPLDQLSTSPSDRSILSNGNNRSGISGGGFGALHRLKRVASNASIASSSKLPPQKTAAAAAVVVPPPESSLDLAGGNKGKSPAPAILDEAAGKGPSKATKASETQGETSQAASSSSTTSAQHKETASSNTIKRPRSPATRPDTAVVKQARRKTWFGLGGAASDDGDVTMAEADSKAGEGSQPQVQAAEAVEASEDVEMTNPPETVVSDEAVPGKSWAAWRGPSEATNGATIGPLSYTDTVLRYVSTASSQTIPWGGWPLWRSDASQQASKVDVPEAEMTSNVPEAEAEPSIAPQEVATASPTPPSLLGRWWPTWRAEDGKLEVTQEARAPPTPAEQVKAEALARMGAKDAVLNEATRSTWISYFSTRSALPSSRVEDMDTGPEIMKLDLNTTKQPKPEAGGSVVPIKDKGKEPTTSKNGKPVGKDDKKTVPDRPNADPAPPTSRPSTPLTNDKDKANKVVKAAAVPSKAKKGDNSSKPPKGPPPPNLLLPSFDDTFLTAPRSTPPSKGMLEKTLSYLFSRNVEDSSKKARKSSLLSIGASRTDSGNNVKEYEAQTRLPRMWSVVGDKERALTKGCKGVKKVSIIGVHGWFSQGPLRNIFGEPTGTSIKFATMMSNAVKDHFEKAGQTLNDDQVSVIALEADGQVADRVNVLFSALLSNPKWIADVLSSDVVFVAAHSQGCIVATHLIARLIEQRHLDISRTRVALLAMCGIHQGPFSHLRSSLATYYFNTFETPAAKELFEYQNSKSAVSMMYAASLRIIVRAGVKLIYVASMDDQVVPLYSALNSSASHPSILRAIFCDGAAFPRVDFLTNLLSFCTAVRNAGLSDHNLLTLLSASVAGSLYGGLGHSLVYEEPQVYSLAVRYLLEVTSPNSYPTTRSSDTSTASTSKINNANSSSGGGRHSDQTQLVFEPFSNAESAKWNSNPFALPWSLRGLLEDELVRKYFDPVIDKLLRDYNEWTPSTKTLRDVQFRLEPMRLVSRQSSPSAHSTSKL